MNNTTVIEKRSIETNYGFVATQAIIDHEKHGRLFICEMYGEPNDLRGGAVRWEHGMAIKIKPEDTFNDLDAAYSDGDTVLDVAMAAYDKRRPLLEWSGHVIEKVAQGAGLQ